MNTQEFLSGTGIKINNFLLQKYICLIFETWNMISLLHTLPECYIHKWNKLGHLAINGQSLDSFKQSWLCDWPFFVTIWRWEKGGGQYNVIWLCEAEPKNIIARQKMIYFMYGYITCFLQKGMKNIIPLPPNKFDWV